MDAEEAYEMALRVAAARAFERRSWVELAEHLHAFHAARAWEVLGHDSFEEWIAAPEVSLGRRTAYRLIGAWTFALAHGVSPEALARVDLTKLSVVLPQVSRGGVSAQEAISDAEALSRSDLVQKYSESPQTGSQRVPGHLLEECPACGVQRVKAEA